MSPGWTPVELAGATELEPFGLNYGILLDPYY
jgi:hypothetical protein